MSRYVAANECAVVTMGQKTVYTVQYEEQKVRKSSVLPAASSTLRSCHSSTEIHTAGLWAADPGSMGFATVSSGIAARRKAIRAESAIVCSNCPTLPGGQAVFRVRRNVGGSRYRTMDGE